MTVFRAFTQRSFTMLWSGQTISRLGDSLYSIALAWWVLQKTGSAAAMGGVLICSTIPMLLLLLVGGVAVDRFSRVHLMLASDLSRGLLVCVVAFLAFQQRLDIWEIFVLSSLFGIVRAFFYPAYTAFIPDLVPKEMLPSANSLRSISTQTAQIIGPAIGATIVAFGGSPLAFALDGVSFFISTICILTLPRTLPQSRPLEKGEDTPHTNLHMGKQFSKREGKERLRATQVCLVPLDAAPYEKHLNEAQVALADPVVKNKEEERQTQVSHARQPSLLGAGWYHDIRTGIDTILRDPWLWVTLVVSGFSTIFLSGPDGAALPLLVEQRFGGQVGLYALMDTVSAVGSIIAAFRLGHSRQLRKRGWLTYGAWLIASLMLLAVGLPISIEGVVIAFFVQGIAIAALGLVWTNTLQEFVPSELLGRVSSIDMLISSGFVPIGYGLAGIAADRLGASTVFILSGIIGAIIIALGLLHPAIRAVD